MKEAPKNEASWRNSKYGPFVDAAKESLKEREEEAKEQQEIINNYKEIYGDDYEDHTVPTIDVPSTPTVQFPDINSMTHGSSIPERSRLLPSSSPTPAIRWAW